MSIDLRHVADVNSRRFAVDGPSASAALGRLSVMRDGDRGETIVPKHQPIATRLASQSSAIRLRLSGARPFCRSRWRQTRRTFFATIRPLST